MIQIICGEKGTGKTKEMLKRANDLAVSAKGTIVYLDKSSQHIYELNNQIRLINVTEYPVCTYEGFIGFVSGLLSGNHDIECIFIDSMIKIANLSDENIKTAIETLEKLSDDVQFICSISLNESALDSNLKEKILVSC